MKRAIAAVAVAGVMAIAASEAPAPAAPVGGLSWKCRLGVALFGLGYMTKDYLLRVNGLLAMGKHC